MELTPRGDEKAKSSPDAMPVVASAFSVSSAAQGLLLWFLALRSASQASNHPWLEVLDMIFLYLQGSRSLEARARAEIQHHLCAGPPLSVRCLDRELMPPMPVNIRHIMQGLDHVDVLKMGRDARELLQDGELLGF